MPARACSRTRFGSAGATLALALLAAVASGGVARAQGPPGPTPVRYTEVVEREVRREVRLTGSVEARDSSLVASEVQGVVEGIEAREGAVVRAGDTLVRLSRTNLELRSRAAAGQIREAQARLDLAERNLERARDLFQSGVISQGEYDDAFSEFTAWQGRVDALTAEIDRIKVDLERCLIRTPFRGIVAAERTEVGQWIDVGDPVVELVSLGRLEVRVEVPERYFPTLQRGAVARVTFESIPGLEVDGKVTSIVPRADPQSRTFPVKLRVSDERGRIGVGMLARVNLPLGDPYNATLVPKDAVVSQGPGRVVFKINGEEKVETVGIDVGRGIGAWVVIDGPLRSGERVVTRGNERLRPGQQVRATALEYELP